MIENIPHALVALAFVAAIYDVAKRAIAANTISQRERLAALPSESAATALNKRLDTAEKRAEEVMRANVNLAKESSRAIEEMERRITAMEARVNNLAARGAIVGAQKNRNATERL